MRKTLTISLSPELRRDVSRAAKAQRVSESEFIRRAVRRQLWADAFDATRRRLVPRARAKRIYTDEDVFDVVSWRGDDLLVLKTYQGITILSPRQFVERLD